MENNLENAMSFLLNAKNASQYEEADDEVTDRWSVFASIMQRYAIQFESQIAENKATHAEDKLLLIATIQRLRAELEQVKVVVPSEEDKKLKGALKEIKKVYYLINNGNLNQEGLTLYYAIGDIVKTIKSI